MTDLPPLTDIVDKNKFTQKDFVQLIRALLSFQGRFYGFKFESDPLLKKLGIDGFVSGNYPGIECPAIFKFIWPEAPINKSTHAEQIKNSFQQALESSIQFRSYVLVTPHNPSEVEKTWLNDFFKDFNIKPYHIGHEIIMDIMKDSTALKKYIYSKGELGTKFFDTTYNNYAESVAHELKHLEFIGLPTGQYQRQELLKPIELTKVYISINFERERGGSFHLQLPQVIKSSNRCVILGNPGTGKSTLVKYLALIYSKQIHIDDELDMDKKIPFIIPLRDFARLQHSKPGLDFEGYLAHIAEKNYNIHSIEKDFFIAMLELGKAIVLFDGLDEITDIERKIKIAKSIKEFSECYLFNPIWVMSQIFGYTSDVQSYMNTFDHYYLGHVLEGQASEFIEKWYHTQIPLNKVERDNRISSLKRAIKENEGVKRLQKNPLLLTMMTLVHQFEGTLPDHRGKLYEKCLELLLKTWHDQKYITQDEENPLEKRAIKYHEQLRLLAAVASYIQTKHQNTKDEIVRGIIGEQELKEVLLKTRYDPSRIRKETAEQDVEVFIDYLRDRVGLFVEIGKFDKTDENVFAFIHLSFLEYLCAYQLSEDRSRPQEEHIEELLNYMKIPSWEEIILLSLHIFSKAPGGNRFTDRFTQEAFKVLSEEPIPECWYLLGRAVRDNISFTFDDTRRIIKELVELWIDNPLEELPTVILTEILDFSLDGKQFLKEILVENIKKEIAQKAFKSLSLYIKWFPLNKKIIEAIRNNSDYMDLFPYLPLYRNEKHISQYIDENLEESHWNVYYNSIKDLPGKNLDRIINYHISKNELVGYIISSWSKIFSALQERNHFLEVNHAEAKDGQQIGKISLDFGDALVEFPLKIFQHFMNTPKAYLDTPGNLKLTQLKNDRIFKTQEKFHLDETKQEYIMEWIDELLEQHFKELDENLPIGYSISKEELQQLKEVRQTFSREFSCYLNNDLISFFNDNFSEEINVFFSKNSNQQDFTNYLYRDFYQYISQDYKRDNNFYISKSFSRFLDKEFSQNFSRNYIRYFQGYLTKEICLNFFKNYNRRFEPQFKQLIKETYGEIFKKSLDWEDLKNVNPLDIHHCFVDKFMKHDATFVNHFFHHLYDYLFFNKIKILFLASSARANVKKEKQSNSDDKWKLIIKEPFIVPFTFDFMLTGFLNHYIIKILAHLNHKYYKNWKPTKSMIRESVEEFCKNHPFHYYILREVWSHYCWEFIKKLQPENTSNNLRLACLITNAAKTSIVTDMTCSGDQWDRILKEAEESQDIFVQVALTLYKMAGFVDRKRNSPQVYFKMREFKEKYPQYFKMIGFTY
ncbi:MAG: hypothetical protein PVH61_05210 [Candidatus Aminicenantes bacterium]|jgi:adenylate kinase family enzyme